MAECSSITEFFEGCVQREQYNVFALARYVQVFKLIRIPQERQIKNKITVYIQPIDLSNAQASHIEHAIYM